MSHPEYVSRSPDRAVSDLVRADVSSLPGPLHRPRRLRATEALRRLVGDALPTADNLVMPLFVREGAVEPVAVESMPGVYQLSVETAVVEAEAARRMGIPAVMLFGIPASKDFVGSRSFDESGVIQQTVRTIKREIPELAVITDVCLCQYTSHGHCGIVNGNPGDVRSERRHQHLPSSYVLNDETLRVIQRVALSHAAAGADIVAPSGMIDGMVAAIRETLDGSGFSSTAILSYSVKYASGFYGPFRDAAEGAPSFGDRRTHQMNPANAREALREVDLDVAEGADILMVKPGLAYLDIIHRVRTRHPEVPLAAFNVSGEYAMLKAAAANGWIDEQSAVLETLAAFKRAGADFVITYHAMDAARWLHGAASVQR